MPKWHPLTSAFRLRPSSSTGTTDPGTSPGGGANLERDRVRQGAPGALAVEAGMVEGVDFESCRMKFFGCLDVVGGVGGRDGGEVILFFFMSFQVFSIQFPRFDLPRSAPTARAARTVQNTQMPACTCPNCPDFHAFNQLEHPNGRNVPDGFRNK